MEIAFNIILLSLTLLFIGYGFYLVDRGVKDETPFTSVCGVVIIAWEIYMMYQIDWILF